MNCTVHKWCLLELYTNWRCIITQVLKALLFSVLLLGSSYFGLSLELPHQCKLYQLSLMVLGHATIVV